MEADYITIMIESLEKKTDVLGHIIELNRQQKLMLQDPNLLPEDFEKNMDYKSQLVDQLNLLDNGFEKLFQRVKETLQENKQQYAVQIEKMQTLIKTIRSRRIRSRHRRYETGKKRPVSLPMCGIRSRASATVRR